MKYQAIKKELLRVIEGMKPNERLWSREAMCRKYSASRSTIDKVVQDLQRGGFIYTVKGSGSYVAPMEGTAKLHESFTTRTWGIIMPDVDFQLAPELFLGINEYTRKHGIELLLLRSFDDQDTELRYIRMFIQYGVQGVIIVPCRAPLVNVRSYNLLRERDIPFVFWQRSMDAYPDAPQISLNGYYGGLIATTHLLDRGYERIAYIAPARFRSSMDRFYGYCSACPESTE